MLAVAQAGGTCSNCCWWPLASGRTEGGRWTLLMDGAGWCCGGVCLGLRDKLKRLAIKKPSKAR